MPNNPLNPQPPIAEPGKERPERDIQQPGEYTPGNDTDEPIRDDDFSGDL
jgi:hypothetical protein